MPVLGGAKVSPTRTFRQKLAPGAEGTETSSTGTESLEDVTLVASVLKDGNKIETSRHESIAFVLIGGSAPRTLTLAEVGEPERAMTQAPGEVSLFGPRTVVVYSPPLESKLVQYRMPATAIRTFAKHLKLGRINSLKSPLVAADPMLHHLSRIMLRLLGEPKASKTKIGDPFVRSFYSHLLASYGVEGSPLAELSGGLSPHHKRIVLEAFSQPSYIDLTIKYLANLCGLSAGHFARAFRESFGRPFHQHVMKTRIHRAKELLRDSELPLGEIARSVGYADQATFTESFARATKTSPGRFRRRHLSTASGRLIGDSTRHMCTNYDEAH
jgi:AraC-like DNA-binding protein